MFFTLVVPKRLTSLHECSLTLVPRAREGFRDFADELHRVNAATIERRGRVRGKRRRAARDTRLAGKKNGDNVSGLDASRVLRGSTSGRRNPAGS